MTSEDILGKKNLLVLYLFLDYFLYLKAFKFFLKKHKIVYKFTNLLNIL